MLEPHEGGATLAQVAIFWPALKAESGPQHLSVGRRAPQSRSEVVTESPDLTSAGTTPSAVSLTGAGQRRGESERRFYTLSYTEEVQVGYMHKRFELIHRWDLFIINILIAFMQITTLK